MPMKNVDATTLKYWMDAGEAVVIDVREPAEHSAERIQGATLIPLSIINQASLPNAKGKKIVIHCRSGKRSSNACEKILAENSNLELYNLDGGILAWVSAGNPVKTSGKFFLPLDRQVQLTVGLMLIASSGLGYLFSPLWFLFTGFIGAGLAIAGVTGFCGLAMIMSRMPWNQKVDGSTPEVK